MDQKHRSNVARVHYQKKRSRSVAQKAKNCMEKKNNDSKTTIEELPEESSNIVESRSEDDMENLSAENSIIKRKSQEK